ncbi:MAG: hypothetical protein IKU53_01940 [Firmicutes bacterium]|nr:hypothetical protein [Bacillota bacterium]
MGSKDVKYKGDREVSFIDEGVKEWLDENKENPKGLCLGRFHADLVVKGLIACSVGDTIEIEDKKYELAKLGKKCFPECELLVESGKKCPLATGVGFGKII